MIRSVRAGGQGPGEARPLFYVAFGPAMITAAVAAVISVAVLLMEDGSLAPAPATVSALWLAVHHVPITVSDISLSILPLIPMLALVAGVARVTRRAAGAESTVTELRNIALCAVAGPLLLTAIALAVVSDAAGEYTVGVPPPFAAFAWTIGVHLVGTGIGFAPGYWRRGVGLARVPLWAQDCARVAARALLSLFVVGAILVLARLAWQWRTVADLVSSGNDAVGMIALVLLSLAYLPNAVLIAAALPVGAGVHVGGATAGLFSAAPAELPSVPILAVMPGGDAPIYLLVLLVVPAVIAVQAGRRCAEFDPELGPTVRNVAASAVLVAAGLTGGAALGGGVLGGLGYAGADLAELFGFTLAWVGLIGVLTAILTQQFGDNRAAAARRREAVVESGGYTTFADEADEPTAQVPTVSRPGGDTADAGDIADASGAPGADRATEEIEPHAAQAGDESPETGDFDAVPTEQLAPRAAASAERRTPAAGRPPARRRPGQSPVNPQREKDIADIEDLDSYTFGD